MRSITIAVPADRTRPNPRGRCRWRLVLAAVPLIVIGTTIVTTLLHRQATRISVPASATLRVTSVPSDIVVEADGKRRGRTPTQFAVTPGDHHLTFQGSQVLASTADVRAAAHQIAKVQAILWLRTPTAEQLRPPFPGASVTRAGFLADGRVALAVALPGDERQLWVRSHDGSLQRLGPPKADGPIASSPDGRQVAYLAPAAPSVATANTPAGALAAVRIVGSDSAQERRAYALAANADDQLVDLSWSPDGSHLLLIVQHRETSGGTDKELRWLDIAQGSARTLLDLPSTILPGSFLWSPTGDDVAFLTQAGSLVSLCVLAVDPPSFHYLADLGQNDTNPLPFPPLAWSADGSHLVYADPVEAHSNTLGGWLFGPRSAPALFSATAPWTQSRRLGATVADAPVWRADGSLLALAQTNGSGPLRLDTVDPGNGAATAVGMLPLPANAMYAVRWDAAHGQALLAQRGDNGTIVFWLLSFISEVAP